MNRFVVMILLTLTSSLSAVFNREVAGRILGEKDYYKILGVEKGASDSVIKKAYYALSRDFHPDKLREESKENQDLGAEAQKKISVAYATLSDADKRRAYDAGIPEGVLPTEEPLTPAQQKIWDDARRELNTFLKKWSKRARVSGGAMPMTAFGELTDLMDVLQHVDKLPEYTASLLTIFTLLFAYDSAKGILAAFGYDETDVQQMKILFDSYVAPHLLAKAHELFEEGAKKVNADEKISSYKKAFDEIFYVAFFKEDVKSLYITKYIELIDSLMRLGELEKARQERENLAGIFLNYWSMRYPVAPKDLDAVTALNNRFPKAAVPTTDQVRQNLLELEVELASLAQATK